MASRESDDIFEQLARMKQEDRDELKAMARDEAQHAVDAILRPELWRVTHPEELGWPGDLADDEAY